MHKSEQSHARLEKASRLKKAIKIISILETITHLDNKKILDIGTGSGHIAQEMGKKCKFMASNKCNNTKFKFLLQNQHRLND